jgi:hypothetical protein
MYPNGWKSLRHRAVRVVQRDLSGPHVHVLPWNAMWAVATFDSRGAWEATAYRNTRPEARRLADSITRRIRRASRNA